MTDGPPFETTIRVRDACLCLHVQRSARALARRFDAALRPVGLTSGQFSLMMSLNRPEPPTMGQVAQVIGLDRTTLTAALKPLERRGLVETRPDSNDRRSRRISLTGEGRALLRRAVTIWDESHARAEALLGGGEADRMREGLRRLEAGSEDAG